MPDDHVDRMIARLEAQGAKLDYEVEGVVSRIAGIHKRVHAAMRQTLAEHGLTPEDWHLMTPLYLREPGKPTSPGALARDLDLSSGAMTSRLDRLEQLGFVQRTRDEDDRRGVKVELTQAGRDAWDKAAEVAGRREAFFTAVLTKPEQRQLNDLLRKLSLALEERLATRSNRPPE
jgi:DNA-binding MarR family transcriptional regulator